MTVDLISITLTLALPHDGAAIRVTRTDTKGNVWGPKQKITVEEAIRVGTINGAYASYEESLKGSIETGKLAISLF